MQRGHVHPETVGEHGLVFNIVNKIMKRTRCVEISEQEVVYLSSFTSFALSDHQGRYSQRIEQKMFRRNFSLSVILFVSVSYDTSSRLRVLKHQSAALYSRRLQCQRQYRPVHF